MAVKLQIRRGLKADLEDLTVGELGYCTDTNELFIGDSEGNVLLNDLTEIQSQIDAIITRIEDLESV
jgi:hypothetical protein